MTNSNDDLEELERRLAACRKANDLSGAADLLARRSGAELQGGKAQKALASMAEATSLFQRAKNSNGEAKSRFGEALVQSVLGAPAKTQQELLRKSIQLATDAKDLVQEMKSRKRLAEILASDNKLPAAESEVTRMIQRLEAIQLDRGLVDVYRHRGSLKMARGRMNDALSDYDKSLDAANRVGDEELRLTVRVERRAVQTYALAGKKDIEPFSELLADAQALGDEQLAGLVLLQEASEHLQAGRHEQGEQKALEGEAAALAAPSPVLYVFACMLIAEAREGLSNRVGVIEVLLTCKSTLEAYFGPEMAKQVVLVLDSLRRRWGDDEVEKAKAGYRLWAEEKMAREGPPKRQ